MPKPRTITQLVVYQNVLLALTDSSEIWMYHGMQAHQSGTDGRRGPWVLFQHQLPLAPDDPVAATQPALPGILETVPEDVPVDPVDPTQAVRTLPVF